MMIKSRILLVAFIATAVIGGILYVNSKKGVEPDNSYTTGKSTKPAPVDKVVFKGYHDWQKWPSSKLLDIVTERAHERNLPQEDRNFFEEQVLNKELPEITRNNMANGLVNCNNPDPKLHRLFMKMYDDKGESDMWRDYCIQFLGTTLAFTSEKEKVQNKLQSIAETSNNNDGATAMVHLYLNNKRSNIELSDAYFDKMASVLNKPTTFHTTKVAIIGIIRGRNDATKSDMIRQCLKESTNDSITRTAIAAIGVLGTKDDKSLVTQYAKHRNKSVQLAVKYSLRNLEKRFGNTEDASKQSVVKKGN